MLGALDVLEIVLAATVLGLGATSAHGRDALGRRVRRGRSLAGAGPGPVPAGDRRRRAHGARCRRENRSAPHGPAPTSRACLQCPGGPGDGRPGGRIAGGARAGGDLGTAGGHRRGRRAAHHRARADDARVAEDRACCPGPGHRARDPAQRPAVRHAQRPRARGSRPRPHPGRGIPGRDRHARRRARPRVLSRRRRRARRLDRRRARQCARPWRRVRRDRPSKP